jgi:hypothetical protein
MTHPDDTASAGWFYRALAPGSGCRVLEIGDAGLANWFDRVARFDDAPDACTASRFDLIVIHRSLGGHPTLRSAVAAFASALDVAGVMALAVDNPWRRATLVRSRPEAPRATLRGCRRALAAAGMCNIRSFAAMPSNASPEHVVQTDRVAAVPFYRARWATSGRRLAPKVLAFRALTALNAMPLLAPGYIATGERC